MNRLRRFLSPQVAELVINSGDDSFLRSHRREIVVVFCDLRGFTPFAESSEPEEVMAVLEEYHAALGELIYRYEGTLERFTGDGLMVFFNDPIPARRARATSGRDGASYARPGRERSSTAGAGSATISASASASPRASPHWVASATKGASTTRRLARY